MPNIEIIEILEQLVDAMQKEELRKYLASTIPYQHGICIHCHHEFREYPHPSMSHHINCIWLEAWMGTTKDTSYGKTAFTPSTIVPY
jgi:hypothetical protein